MLRTMKSLEGVKIGAKDGEIGKVDSFLFEDTSWLVRYVVVDTGGWLPGRKILIPQAILKEMPERAEVLPVPLTKEEVEQSPDIDTDRPVSREAEQALYQHYAWTPYWSGAAFAAPMSPPSPEDKKEVAVQVEEEHKPHLRSSAEVIGYRLHATDGDLGHVDDLVFEDEAWVVRYLIVDTRKWLPGKKVLLSPHWAEKISWSESKVYVEMRKEEIKKSPEYDSSKPISRDYESRLYEHYGRTRYWS